MIPLTRQISALERALRATPDGMRKAGATPADIDYVMEGLREVLLTLQALTEDPAQALFARDTARRRAP